MTTCEKYSCQREEQCDDCFLKDHLKECSYCEHYDHPARPDGWVMADPPEAFAGIRQSQAGDVDELDIISQLPEGVY